MSSGGKSKPVSDFSVIWIRGVKCFVNAFWCIKLWKRLIVSLAELRLLIAVEIGLEPRPYEILTLCFPQRKLIHLIRL